MLGPNVFGLRRVKPIQRQVAMLAVAALAGALAPMAAASGKPNPAPLSPFAQGILDTHNRERSRLGSPPLRWDPALEAAAAAHARQLAAGGSLTHASRSGRTNQRENLSMGMRGSTARQLMQNWIDEKRNFLPGIFPDVSRTGQWSDASHYSQMIWSATTSVGCAQATGLQWDYLVCRYAPAGNIDGRPALENSCGPRPGGAGLGSAEPRLARQQPAPWTQVCI